MIASPSLIVRIATALALAVLTLAPASAATEVERVVSPMGIEAWLVHSPTAPLIAIDFAFRSLAIVRLTRFHAEHIPLIL